MGSPVQRPETPLVSTEKRGASSFGECGNCGAPLTGSFCSQCGEKKLSHEDHSFRHLAEEVVGEFTHLDSKLVRTLKALLTKPGEISRAYFRGGRSRYTKPLTLFVIINVAFFFMQPHTKLFSDQFAQYSTRPNHAPAVRAHLLETREPELRYAARFDANLQNQKKSILIFSVPLLALVMGIVFIGIERTYAEHVVFSIQVYAFLLSFLGMAGLLMRYPIRWLVQLTGPRAGSATSPLESENAIAALLIVALTIYMYAGFRRAYETSKPRSVISAFVLALATALLIVVYHEALFYLTFWTT